MAGPYPPEFRQQAVEPARLREKPVAEIATDLGISNASSTTGCARRRSTRARDGLTAEERAELVKLRRASRVLAMENEILNRRTVPVLTAGHSASD